MVADSRASAGASPFAVISAAPGSDAQLSLFATTVPEESYKVRTGSARVPVNPDLLSDGPRARNTTFLGLVPVTIKPPIKTLSPLETAPRVERLSSCGPNVGNLVS